MLTTSHITLTTHTVPKRKAYVIWQRGGAANWSEASHGREQPVPIRYLSRNMPTILNAASGSANPATSLSALWAYLQPALDHIVKSPSTDSNGKAPAIDFGLYAGIHSACYN